MRGMGQACSAARLRHVCSVCTQVSPCGVGHGGEGGGVLLLGADGEATSSPSYAGMSAYAHARAVVEGRLRRMLIGVSSSQSPHAGVAVAWAWCADGRQTPSYARPRLKAV